MRYNKSVGVVFEKKKKKKNETDGEGEYQANKTEIFIHCFVFSKVYSFFFH